MRAAAATRCILAIAAQVCVLRSAWSIQTTIGGRQVDLDVRLSVREVVEENHATTRERTLEQARVRAAVSLAHWLRFDVTAVVRNGGPTVLADRAGFYSSSDVFQDLSPAADIDEAYFDVRLASIDLRIGKQKIAWGKLDRRQPNDLINPLSYADPFLEEEAERKIGVPALQVSYYPAAAAALPAESRLTAVWVPRYVPFRFPLAACDVAGGRSQCHVERWFPPAALPPTSFSVPLPGGGAPSGVSVPLGFRTHNAPLPAARLENSEIGLRYSGNVRDLDLAFYYFHGYDPEPAFDLTAEAFGRPDPRSPGNPLRLKDLFGITTLSPRFHQIDSWGADFAFAAGRFSVRAEAAVVRGRPFSRDVRLLIQDPQALAAPVQAALGRLAQGSGRAVVDMPPSFAVRDAVEWGLGADYSAGGYLLLLQLNQTDVLRNDVELLIKNVETRLLATVRKNYLSDSVQARLVAIHAIESDYTILLPKLFYQFTDHLGGELGYLFIAGRAHSMGGQYRRNDEAWVRAEYKL